jgi:hypothetical protein
MIKSVLFLLLSGASASAWAAPAAPSNPSVAFVPSVQARALANAWKFQLVGGGEWRWEAEQREVRSVQLGSYFRILPWLQVGAFYQSQWGARHNDDWMSFEGNWAWLNTNGRREDVGSIDVTLRQTLGGDDSPWLIELKTRLVRNFYNNQTSFMWRPGIFHYWRRGGKPFITMFAQVESYAALNFLPGGIYETWIYAGALWSATPWLQVGARGEFHSVTWGTSSSFQAAAGTRYNVTAYTGGVSGIVVLPIDLTEPR